MSVEELMVSKDMSTTTRRRGVSRAERHKWIAGYLFVIPFMIVFVAMLIVPLVYAGYLSMFRTTLIGGNRFVQFQNYVQAFTDPKFLSGLGRTALFLIIQVPIMLGLALFIALAIDSGRVRGHKGIRILAYLPYAVPGVVATMMWGYLYGDDFGPISQALRGLGFGAPHLLSADKILGSMMNIVTWEYTGYNMIIMYSALRAIPGELYEAAEIDGAGPIRTALSIKIPAIMPAILLTVIFSIIGSFQLFNEPSLMRTLNPAAINSYYTPNFYAYNLAFINQDINYAAAISFVLGIVIAIVSFVVQARQRES